MKVCISCYQLNPDDAEKCIRCGESDFVPFINVPFYNSEEPYKEESEK